MKTKKTTNKDAIAKEVTISKKKVTLEDVLKKTKSVILPSKPVTKRDIHFYDMGAEQQAKVFGGLHKREYLRGYIDGDRSTYGSLPKGYSLSQLEEIYQVYINNNGIESTADKWQEWSRKLKNFELDQAEKLDAQVLKEVQFNLDEKVSRKSLGDRQEPITNEKDYTWRILLVMALVTTILIAHPYILAWVNNQ